MNPPLRAPLFDDFDFDTITVSQALAWLILVGCTIAGVLGLSGLSLASRPRTPRIFAQNSVSLVANNQGALDVMYAMVVAEIQ